MNITQRIALDAGFKLVKPEILTHYYPLTFEKYIVFQPDAKFNSRKYDYWGEVIGMIGSTLRKMGYTLVSVGAPGEKAISGTENLIGKTTINQLAYIIKNAALVVAPDSLSCHLAGVFDVPFIGLYSNMHPSQSEPYWGSSKKRILIEADRGDLKPTYMADESPKTINNIKPEEICAAIFKLLGINAKIELESLWFGQFYNHIRIENVPDQVITLDGLGIDSLIVRMDFLHHEDNLAEQLKICKCSIITNKPINEQIIKNFKDNIIEVIYEIDKNHDIKFVEMLQKNGINYVLYSHESNEFLNKIKLDYLDYKLINPKQKTTKDAIEKLKNKDLKRIVAKTKKYTLSQGKIFPSKAHWLIGAAIPNFQSNTMHVIDSSEFWNESENFYFVEDKSELQNKPLDYSQIVL